MENKKNEVRNTIQINKISESTKKSFKVRVISALIALVIVVPALFLGDWAFLAVIVFALGVGVVELIKCAKKKYSRWSYVATFVFTLAIVLWPMVGMLVFHPGTFWDVGHVYSGYDRLYIPVIAVVASIFALFYVIMWDENFTVRDACFIFTIGLLVAMGLQSLLFLRFFPTAGIFNFNGADYGAFYNYENTIGSMWLILYLLIATFGTDIGAYAFGILFGHEKVNPRISPNKTWGGFWGGLIVSAFLSMLFAFIMALTGNPIMPVRTYNGVTGSIFDLEHWYNIVVLSLIIPPFATLGDFVFSAIKRFFEIKDFGNIMPGHGGILDRIDSLIFSSLIMAAYVVVAFAIQTGSFTFLLI